MRSQSDEEDDSNAVRSKPVALKYGTPAGAPRSSYLKQLDGGYTEDLTPVKPKRRVAVSCLVSARWIALLNSLFTYCSKLLITDLDNTLFGPSGAGVIAVRFLPCSRRT